MGKISSDLVSSEFVTTDNKDAVKLDEVGEPTDNTDLNVDAARHGLCPKLSGNADDALKGDGTWGGGSFLDFTGDPNDRLAGDEVFRPANFESLESVDFVDQLNNSSIHPNWTQNPNTGTVTEDLAKLVSSHAGGSTVSWWTPDYNIPSVGIPIEPYDFDMLVHVGNIDPDNNAALVVLHLSSDNTKYIRMDLRYESSEYRVYTANNDDGGSSVNTGDIGQNNCWLAMIRRGGAVTIGYSTNNENNQPDVDDITVLDTFDQAGLFPMVGNLLKLGGGCWAGGTAPGVDANYKNFSIKYNTVSTRLRGYVGQGIDFHDNLNDSRLHDNWTQDIPVAGTIAEDGTKLSISHAGGTTLSWHSNSNTDAPNVFLDLEPYDFTIMVHVSNIGTTDGHGAGIISYLDGAKLSFYRWILERNAGVYRVDSMANSTGQTLNTIGQNNCWLAFIRRGHKVSYLYSLNSVNNKPASIDDMELHETVDVAFAYTKNRLALAAVNWGSNPAYDIHFQKFSLVYNNISLYQNESYLVEQMFITDGTETPGATKTFSLNKQPGGHGIADTPSGYHLLVHRGTLKLDYTGTLSNELEYEYNPVSNAVSVQASGDEEKFSVALMEPAPTTQKIQEGSFKWKYLGEDSEIGLNTLACYQFDGSAGELNDRTGNGYTLTVADGTRYYNTVGGIKALEFNGALGLLGPDTEDLRITGAITVEFVGLIREKSSTRGHIVYIGGDVTAAESLITNVLMNLRITTSNLFEYAGEYDAAGTDVVCSAFSQKFQNEVHYFAMTRSSDGLTIKLYIDGVLVQTRTADHITEKDASGNLHRLTIGNWYTTGSDEFLDGALSSVRISSSELTPTQIANVYDQIKTTNIETPVALSLDQQGYIVEDNFSDSEIHSRWTVVEPGSSTVTEGSDGVALTTVSTDDPHIQMSVPDEMIYRNWVIQVHCTFAFTGAPGEAASGQIQLWGKGGGDDKYFIVMLLADPSYKFRMQDGDGSSTISGSSTMWMRLRRFGDEIRADYYSGAHTVNVDDDGYWVEYDSAKTWYVVPKSATYHYPITYTHLRLKCSQWSVNPGATVTFRKFKLRIF